MGWFEFILRVLGILVPPAHEKRAAEDAERDEPLIDIEEERRKAERGER